jgi:hypothetical protein
LVDLIATSRQAPRWSRKDPVMKPDKKTQPRAYAAWVRRQVSTWDPADDRGGPTVYVPRFNGIRAADIEHQEDDNAPKDS